MRILELKESSFIRNQKLCKSVMVMLNCQSFPPLSALNNSLANSGDDCIPIEKEQIWNLKNNNNNNKIMIGKIINETNNV